MKTNGTFIEHIPCPKCDSSDNLAVYEAEDGSHNGYCWGCETYFSDPYDNQEKEDIIEAGSGSIDRINKIYPFAELKSRGINQQTCEYFGVRVLYSEHTGEELVHFYPYYKKGKLTGWKRRKLLKEFTAIGDIKKVNLFGQHLCGKSGKMLLITEGELDAMAAWQMFMSKGKNYRVCSLPTGANSKAIKQHLEWIERFEKVVLCFDQDEKGQEIAIEIASILSPGRAKIMEMSEKDANDMLQAGKTEEFYRAVGNSKDHTPDGIASVQDLLEEAVKPVEWGLPWPWEELTKKTYGRRRKELYGFGGGTGCGKTEGFKEIIQHVISQDKLSVGLFFLEEPPATTLKIIAGKIANKRFHVPDGDWTEEELDKGIRDLDGMVYLYNHFGQKDWDTLKSKIRYMVISLGIKDIFLDHLTALVADEADVNGALSSIMEEMASLTQELDFTLYFISHLSTPQGTSHEEGGRVTVSQFRGSRTIGFWSHFLMGYERNQQSEDEDERNTTTFRVLKDRYTGLATGHTFKLFYDHTIGRMIEKEGYDEFE